MMNKYRNIVILLLTFFVLNSCTKVIHIDLNNADPKLVIEGNITDQAGPYFVSLTKSIAFEASNNFPGVSGAFVTITDNNGVTDTLSETQQGTYQTHQLTGIPGHTYTLHVQVDGKTYTAQSSMPLKVNLDSVGFLKSDFGSSPSGKDTVFVPVPRFLDPPVFGNYYRFKLITRDTIDNGIYVDSDNLINGLPYQRPIFSNDLQCKRGDSLVLEMQCINRSIYDYFFSLNESIGNGPGGGATPSNPVSNISGDALGYFSAHTTQTIKTTAQ